MAAFASSRRSGWVRLLVLILCALFIFATLGAPPAQALGVESVAVFGLASVLSAATAALGFKLSSNEQGQVTLQKMVQDFKTVAWATGFVLVGSKLNGLQHGMDYIKMQVQNGKTYLDSRVFAWVQQWLAKNGVYNSSSNIVTNYVDGQRVYFGSSFDDIINAFPDYVDKSKFYDIMSLSVFSGNTYNDGSIYSFVYVVDNQNQFVRATIRKSIDKYNSSSNVFTVNIYGPYSVNYINHDITSIQCDTYTLYNDNHWLKTTGILEYAYLVPFRSDSNNILLSNFASFESVNNNSGLSGTDTLGKDVVDLTLDQVLEKLKEWAQDWFDAGADSATNAATGALDLPLTVATGAATSNPSIAEDGPLVWFPSFGVPVPTLRTGETDTKTVDQGKENASAAETSTVDVAENQTVIDSLVNWALSYISPDTGLFSKFPLCVPYDAYLLVTSSLGVDAVGSDSIFGASPGDLDGVVSQDIDTYSDFQPIINIKHDFELDGKTYPVELTIDLTPWQPLVTFFREGMALLLVAELIGSEFKRIRGH